MASEPTCRNPRRLTLRPCPVSWSIVSMKNPSASYLRPTYQGCFMFDFQVKVKVRTTLIGEQRVKADAK